MCVQAVSKKSPVHKFFLKKRLTDKGVHGIIYKHSARGQKQKTNIAGWSSSVARRAHNPKVVGSNPAPATIIKALIRLNQGFFRTFQTF